MRSVLFFVLLYMIILPVSVSAQSRKAIQRSGDVLVFATPVAGLVTTLVMKDYEGLKQAVFSGATAVATTYALKYIVQKQRPDGSNNLSFPSGHTSVSFTGAAFIQRRYGWKFGAPAYLLSSYVAWSRVYAKKHDWWDVLGGAAIGIGSAYIFTHPFAKKHNLALSPVIMNDKLGIYASMTF